MDAARSLRGQVDGPDLAFAVIEALAHADPGEQDAFLEAERLLEEPDQVHRYSHHATGV